MAAVTNCNDFGAQENKVCHCFHCFPIYFPWNGGTRCNDFSVLKVEFSASFFTLLIHFHSFIKRLFSISLFSVIRVMPSAYLRLLIFLLAVLISTCASASPEFHMIYFTYKLNKQGDNIQPWRAFTIRNQSVVPCPVLTVASWPAYKFLKRQVRWSGILISFRIFQFIMIHTVKGFGIVNKAEIDAFSGTLLLFPWSGRCWQFDLWFLCLF